ncbi:antibiotic biosynthesis monooxygenase [Herbaspirillum sp. LeCh32-8]|uniref:antibiotic biosynthesis monooxygenase n=1 Tax=Herbaspirillum sp. LeCh32-8 TaxID=2821356 RepID=UPI001AE35F66|nr:antibiotic biosynthesis monooxygenase [Herbaspirillum sp. LeCh32-8]MBP0598316.1 antibiotic biosynthesis monooxygenase [Herbaspirillum sp. LeCh32-8]
MNPDHAPFDPAHGATVVITHHIRHGMHAQYEAWLKEVASVSQAAEGIVDWQVVRPLKGVTTAYTVILRFASEQRLHAWMDSPARAAHIERVKPFLARDDQFFVRSGLDFWFTPEGAKAKLPVRWKQFLLTWSAIFPLSLAMSQLVLPLLHQLGLPSARLSDGLLASALLVALMVYVVMPRYTRLVQRWLFDDGN